MRDARAEKAEGRVGLKWREDKVREVIAMERRAFLGGKISELWSVEQLEEEDQRES